MRISLTQYDFTRLARMRPVNPYRPPVTPFSSP